MTVTRVGVYVHSRMLIGIPVVILLAGCTAVTDPHSSPTAVVRTSQPSPTPSPTLDPATALLAECAGTDAPAGEEVELALRAEDFQFDTDLLEGPRHCEPFAITLYNADPAAEHNVVIELGSQTGSRIFAGELTGPRRSTTYQIPALPAGHYRFLCAPHAEAMQGVLVVAADG